MTNDQLNIAELPELPEPIGEIVGRRFTPEDTTEFWGYFAKSYKGENKERVYTADQVLAAQAQLVERIKELERIIQSVKGPLVESHNHAIRMALEARIPECGDFGGIAQNLGWALDELKAATNQGGHQNG